MKLVIFSILLISIIGIDAIDKTKDCKCRINPLGRIVNGRESSIQSYPWHARIVYKFNFHKNWVNLCSGTILNEQTILTAGSCFLRSGNNPRNLRVVIKGSEELFEIDYVNLHPQYRVINSYHMKNDIAILKLRKSLTLSNLIQPGCINLIDKKSYEDVPFTAAGYGFKKPVIISYGNYLDDEEYNEGKFTETEVYDQTYYLCSSLNDMFDKDNLLCVGSRNNRNLCVGDEGTAALQTVNGRSNVVGVVGMSMISPYNQTHFQRCSIGNRGIKISAYRSFIEDNVGDNYCHN